MVLRLNKKKVIVIIGPTGIGKTDLALKLAKFYGFNIISADAFQIYKEINIGTNKPDLDEIKDVSYYGLNLVDLNYNYSIFQFQKYARKIIDESSNPTIIVGGSMLYLDSVIYDYNLRPEFDNSKRYEELSNSELYEKLTMLDPISARTLNVNNRKRIITALNYFLQFHESIRANTNKKIPYYDFFVIYLKPTKKEILNEKNAKRIDLMLEKGWIKEVEQILSKYPNFLSFNSSKAIGYKEIALSILNNEPVNKQAIVIKTNRYVKHQLSWYNNQYVNQKNIFITSNINDSQIIDKLNLFLK